MPAIPLATGYSPSSDELAGGTPSVVNFLTTPNGENRLRPGRAAFIDTSGASTTLTQASASPTMSATVFRGEVYFVAENRYLYRIDKLLRLAALSTSTTSTQVEGSAVPTFAEDSQRLVIAGGGRLQTYVPGEAAAKRLVTDPPADAVTNDVPWATHVVSLGNYLVVNDARDRHRFQWSRIGDGVHEFFPQLAYNTADAKPDAVTAVKENGRELFVFGERSVQVYGVIGDPFLPFIVSSNLSVGCTAVSSIVDVDGSFAWLDPRNRFVISNGHGEPVDIGADVQRDLTNMATVSDCKGYRWDIGPWHLLVWEFKTEKTCLAYDMVRKAWLTLRSRNSNGEWDRLGIGAYVWWPDKRLDVAFSDVDAWAYKMDFDSRVDFAATSTTTTETGYRGVLGERISPMYGKPGTYNAVERAKWVMRRGEAAVGSAADYLEVAYRNELGAWGDPERLALGDKSDRNPIVEHMPGGVYEFRQARVRYGGVSDLVLVGAEEITEPRR